MPGQLFVERRQRGLGAEHQIGGILNLHQAPTIGLLEGIEHRAAQGRVPVKDAVKHAGRKAIGQLLRTVPIGDAQKGIVPKGETDAFGRKLARQPAMAVAVNLQAERRPKPAPAEAGVGTRTYISPSSSSMK